MSSFEKKYDKILLGDFPSYLQCICMNHDKSSMTDIILRQTCQLNTLLGIHFYGKIMISYLCLQGGADYILNPPVEHYNTTSSSITYRI